MVSNNQKEIKKNQSRKGKFFIGQVVSDKMEKTVVVEVKRRGPHPRYLKVITTKKKFYADNRLGAKEGDWVEIQETRPLSRLKRFRVIRIVKKGGQG